ncbi:hypothetical protein V8G54_014971 [Vigna mungo]|uniref:Phosphatidic acid phosphatase type 2/haloperoxidase domain-containing protein n=1 Tax=Vigna mungo TaxID=3915 RepID=A0AAQ3RZR4_VIGMU
MRSFAGLGFLAWYLSGKIKVFDRRGHVAKLCIVFFPLLVASMIAVSRVDDYRHHWQDVCAGGFIGALKTGFSLFDLSTYKSSFLQTFLYEILCRFDNRFLLLLAILSTSI